MDAETKAFFKRLIDSDPENKVCTDCGVPHPQWASVSYGNYFCLSCSGQHRSLGVHISFVRSISMDTWNAKQKAAMQSGGNTRFKQFCKEQEIDSMPITQKYHTKAAEYYRDLLKAERDGSAKPAPLPRGAGKQPAAGAPGAFSMNNAPAASVSASPGGFGNAGSGMGSSSYGNPAFANTGGYHGRTQPAEESGGGFWGAVSFAGRVASRAKEVASDTVRMAQREGVLEAAKSQASAAASWTAETAAVAHATVTDEAFLNNAWSSAQSAATSATEYARYGYERGQAALAGGPVAPSRGDRAAAALSKLSTGKMQGFGSDSYNNGAVAEPTRGERNAEALRGLSTGKMQGFGSDSYAANVDVRGQQSQSMSYSSPPPAQPYVADAAPAPKRLEPKEVAPMPKVSPKKPPVDFWADSDDWFDKQ